MFPQNTKPNDIKKLWNEIAAESDRKNLLKFVTLLNKKLL